MSSTAMNKTLGFSAARFWERNRLKQDQLRITSDLRGIFFPHDPLSNAPFKMVVSMGRVLVGVV
jgi:hypothetical protein